MAKRAANNQVHLEGCNCYLGSDPEVFISRISDGVVVGSDMVPGIEAWQPGLVRDGVQVEFHPPAYICRANMGGWFAVEIKAITNWLLMRGFQLDFRQTIDIDPEVFERLSPDSRVLGCNASLNIYGDRGLLERGSDFRTRSAGGHIHIDTLTQRTDEEIALWVKLLDVVVGNTGVLLDRDSRSAERRETYGKAGEYRLPPTPGYLDYRTNSAASAFQRRIEYRTLSNFWLRAYPFMSLMMGLVKLAGSIAAMNKDYGVADDLLAAIDQQTVRDAINTNDFDLAMKTWRILTDFILNDPGIRLTDQPEGGIPPNKTALQATYTVINHGNIKDWAYLIAHVEELFPRDLDSILASWNFTDGHGKGGESSLGTWIHKKRIESEQAASLTSLAQPAA